MNYTVVGIRDGRRIVFSANAETIEEALYVTEGYLKRVEGATVEIGKEGYGEPWLTLTRDAFVS